MPVEFIRQGLREYEITCNECGEKMRWRTVNKQTLRNGIRMVDWIWRDTGILGIVECICPECQKK